MTQKKRASENIWALREGGMRGKPAVGIHVCLSGGNLRFQRCERESCPCGMLTIIDLQRLYSEPLSLLIRSVNCYLKVNFSDWFSLHTPSENHAHSQRLQSSQYGLSKLNLFKTISKCAGLYRLMNKSNPVRSQGDALRACIKEYPCRDRVQSNLGVPGR